MRNQNQAAGREAGAAAERRTWTAPKLQHIDVRNATSGLAGAGEGGSGKS